MPDQNMTNPPNSSISSSADDDWLDDLLKEEPAYIDDAGFTAKVVTRLPVPSRAIWLRRAILGISILAAVLVAWLTLPPIQSYSEYLSFSATFSRTFILEAIAAIALVFAASCFVWVSQEK